MLQLSISTERGQAVSDPHTSTKEAMTNCFTTVFQGSQGDGWQMASEKFFIGLHPLINRRISSCFAKTQISCSSSLKYVAYVETIQVPGHHGRAVTLFAYPPKSGNTTLQSNPKTTLKYCNCPNNFFFLSGPESNIETRIVLSSHVLNVFSFRETPWL